MHPRHRAAAFALGLAACDAPTQPPEEDPAPGEAPATAAPPTSPIAEVLRGPLDLRADPCEDFYRFACGGWLDHTELPADRSLYGRGFGERIDRNEAALRGLLEEAARDPGVDPRRRLYGSFYAACVDEAAIDAGASSLRPWPDGSTPPRIARPSSPRPRRVHARVTLADDAPLFAARIEVDAKRPDVYVLTLDQGGLGLPDRGLYLATGPDADALRDRYRDHVAATLVLLGAPAGEAARDAATILDFEAALARLALPRTAMREPESLYHRLGEAGLAALAPRLPWSRYFEGLDVGPIGESLIVRTPDFFKGLPRALDRLDARAMRAYLRWHLGRLTADHLSAPFVADSFQMSAALTGQAQLAERPRRCTELASAALGDFIAPDFVARSARANSTSVAITVVEAVERAFAERLEALTWMDPRTRARARDKLRAITNKIGQPPLVPSAAGLELRPDLHLENVVALRTFALRRHAGGIGGPVDRAEWESPPTVLNAFYGATGNEITLPAAILLPPYFSPEWPMAMNFGAIGMVVGHELTHGFDDEGRKYDLNGVLREWWEPETIAAFGERAQCLDDAYSAVEVLPGLHLDGHLTLGENIADMGGITAAHAAYTAWIAERGPEPRILPELTNEQVFFVAFAQSWCSLASPEITRLLVATDFHSPPPLRVDLPLSHLPAFWEAFHCDPGKPMHTPRPCDLW
ncbi:MAG: M13 family metallopeptidase [Nannocystaceae bacterium]